MTPTRSGWSIGLPLLVALALLGGIAFTAYLIDRAEREANAALSKVHP